MKVPESYVGKFVCVHLAAPVYMFGYGAHVKWAGQEQLMPMPILREVQTPEGIKQSQAMSNLLPGVRVVEVSDDSVVFELYDPHLDGRSGVIMHKLVPCSLIVSLDTVHSVDVAMPTVTPRVAVPAPSRIIAP